MATRGVAIAALGPLQVRRRGQAVLLRPAQRRLLSILLLEPTRLWAADALVDRMWGDDPPESARNALHVHLAGLRRHLPGLVVSEPGGYRLAEGGWEYDRVDFEKTVGRCLAAEQRRAWPTTLSRGRQAAALWRGEPFAEIADHHHARGEVDRLWDLRVRVHEALAAALLATGHTDRALEEARAASSRDALRERPRALVMLALYRSGRQAEALRQFEDYRRTLGEATGLEPGREIRTLEERILLQDESLGTAPEPVPAHNLPRSRDSFVGRATEMTAIMDALDSGGVITIVGAPGSGKSRLAVEAGRARLARHPGGVWLIPLGGAATEPALVATVSTAMGLTVTEADADSLAAALEPRPILLVLDACEGVLEPAGRLVSLLSATTRPCRVLATSRRPLGAPGEVILRLGPLGIDTDEGLALLLDRVRAVDRGFTVTPANREALVMLCQRVGGSPLAMELVARWIPALGVTDTTRLLDQVGATGAVEATFEWSRDLLAGEDRELLPALAGFSAPFTLDRAAAVAGSERSATAIAGSIARLVDASLLSVESSPGITRYRMLDPIRDIASADSDREAWQERHAAALVAAAPGLASALTGQEQAHALRGLDVEMPDHRHALEHLERRQRWGDLAVLVPALVNYWYARFLGWEGRQWLDAIPRDRLSDSERGRVEQAAGFLAWAVHDYDAADRAYRWCLEDARRRADAPATASALYGLGLIHQKRRFEDGAAMLEEAAAIYRSLEGSDLELGQCLLFRGIDEALNGHPGRGETLLAEAVTLLEVAGHTRQVSKAERWRAHAAWRQRDEASARTHAESARNLAEKVDDHIALAGTRVELANIEIEWGSPVEAARHLRAALAPVPADDEVDRAQVLQPIARLALTQGEPELAADLVAYIADVYDRHGWRPLSDDPAARELQRRVVAVPVPEQAELLERVEALLARAAG